MKILCCNLILAAVCTAVTCASVGHAPAAASHALSVENMGSGTVASYVQYTKADSLKVVGLLESASELSGRANVTVFFARKLLGLPYVAHTLEVNRRERLVVNLRQLDCTTYVENVVALTMCARQKAYTFNAFCDNLRTIRYRGGSVPHYVKRLHYFTDWIEDNTAKGLCREVQAPVPPFTAVQDINVYYMSTYPEKYKMLKDNPEYVPQIAETEKALNKKSFRYVPKSAVKNTTLLRSTIKDGDRILIAEGCTHHRQCDDIGTVKLPNWIRKYTKAEPQFVFTSGTEFPQDLSGYRLVIHCGGCMLNEREMQSRLQTAQKQNVPMSNYGTAIAYMNGILQRTVRPLNIELADK